jgi:hypothetical protein
MSFDGRRQAGDTVTLFSCGGRADGGKSRARYLMDIEATWTLTELFQAVTRMLASWSPSSAL